jgi:hypothetical protein
MRLGLGPLYNEGHRAAPGGPGIATGTERETDMVTTLRRSALVLLAAGSMLLSATSLVAASGQAPFKATFFGTAQIASDGMSATFQGAGSSTRLGRITTIGDTVVTGTDDVTCPGGLKNTNTETLTDNDGDSITISSDDVGCPEGYYRFHGIGHWHVAAGTGRFAGTIGQGSFDGHSDFPAGTFTITLTGTLSN